MEGRQGQMRRFDLLVFDWDGTLADSAANIVASMQAAIAALDLPPRSDAQIRELIGLGFGDGLGRLYPELDVERVLELIAGYRARYFGSHAYEAPLFAGAADALEDLAGQGYWLTVATGKSRRGLDRALEHHSQAARLLVSTRTADETAPKPDPTMLRELLFELDVAPERTLMIGDTTYDTQMARSIGVTMLGVACGVHDASRLLDAGAAAVVDDVAAVPRWLYGTA